MTAQDRCQKMFEKVKAMCPDVGLSFGYIGNCGSGWDDRSWYYFTNVLNGKYCFQFGGYRTANLERLAEWAESCLEMWVREEVQPHAADRWRCYHLKGNNIRHQRRQWEEKYGFGYGLDAQHEAIISVRGMTPEQVAKALPGVETFECDAGGHPI